MWWGREEGAEGGERAAPLARRSKGEMKVNGLCAGAGGSMGEEMAEATEAGTAEVALTRRFLLFALLPCGLPLSASLLGPNGELPCVDPVICALIAAGASFVYDDGGFAGACEVESEKGRGEDVGRRTAVPKS